MILLKSASHLLYNMMLDTVHLTGTCSENNQHKTLKCIEKLNLFCNQLLFHTFYFILIYGNVLKNTMREYNEKLITMNKFSYLHTL